MNILGIDIGGTSIKGAIVSDKGEIITDKFSLPIVKGEEQTITINKLVKLVEDFLAANKAIKISGIGIGIPGSLDTEKGVVDYSNNLRWKNLKIVEIFKKTFDLPIKISNDANVATLGEAYFGAGKMYKNIVMITLGTGVGGGVVIDGKLFEGYLGKGTELGHTTLVYDGLPCSCGRKGCLETYASATALIRQTKEAMTKNKKSKLWDEVSSIDEVNGKTVFDAMRKGDKVAAQVVDQYISYLAEGLLNFCNIFRPECIVLSGGIAKEGDFLTDKLTKYMEAQNFGYPYAPKTEIKIANLGYNSGIIGAASLLMNK